MRLKNFLNEEDIELDDIKTTASEKEVMLMKFLLIMI
jgi:hypothetical protein